MLALRNLFYYIKKFGCLSFEEFPFNEVDSLMLSQLSYLNLKEFVPNLRDSNLGVNLQTLLTPETIKKLCVETLDEKRNCKLLKLLKNTTRYQGFQMNYYEEHFNVDKIEQFCGVTFLFSDFIYLAYRGTDLSLLGWKENFTMAFLDVIPSQEDASLYLERVSRLEQKKIYLGGHSKGGNLAVYAALYANPAVQDRIIKIYDHDGPGFQTDIFADSKMKALERKIEKTSCREARVGILLHHSERIRFVDSRGFGILQHDPYNWKVTKEGAFKLVHQANLISRTFEKTVNDFIEITSIEDKKMFFEIVFKIVMEHDHATIFDIKRHPIRYSIGMRKRFMQLSFEEQKHFKKLLKRYKQLWRYNFKLYLRRKIHFKGR